MQKFHDTVQDVQGNGLTTASIYVYVAGSGTPAALKKDDETTVLSNPITIADTDNYDSEGNYGFKAANGIYDIKIVVGASTKWKRERVLFDFSDNTIFTDGVNIADTKFLYFGSDLRIRSISNQGVIENLNSTFYLIQAKASGLFQLNAANSVGTVKKCVELGGATPYVRLYYDNSEVCHTQSDGIESGVFSVTGASAGKTFNATQSSRSSYTGTGTSYHYSFYNANGSVGSISTNGTATAYNTTSDKRLKTSHGLLTNAADIVNSIGIHEYHFNSDDSVTLHGVMAQDCNEVYPNAISYDEESDTWGADYSKLVPIMLANIQDLNKQVEALTCQQD